MVSLFRFRFPVIVSVGQATWKPWFFQPWKLRRSKKPEKALNSGVLHNTFLFFQISHVSPDAKKKVRRNAIMYCRLQYVLHFLTDFLVFKGFSSRRTCRCGNLNFLTLQMWSIRKIQKQLLNVLCVYNTLLRLCTIFWVFLPPQTETPKEMQSCFVSKTAWACRILAVLVRGALSPVATGSRNLQLGNAATHMTWWH